MATTRALAATGEAIEDSELTVTSALTVTVKAFLPAVEDGSGTTVAAGYQVVVSANSSGDVEIVDVFGRRVHTVGAGETFVFEAHGDATRPEWTVAKLNSKWMNPQAAPSAGSSTPALGTTGPAASGTVKWIGPVTLADGTVAYIPCWT